MVPWSHGCIEAGNRSNNTLTGVFDSFPEGQKFLAIFDLNYKYQLVRELPSISTASLNHLAAEIKLLQAQYQEASSPMLSGALALAVSCRSITQLQLEQTVGLAYTLSKRRDPVV